MATLVLTTIGGLAGGPIGAALGGVLGQAVDRTVLFKPRGRQGPRLTELAVQTSSYGRPIPLLFGRMRVAGQVIWATDLVEHRERQGGGKGQPSLTTFAYSASFAVALSARPIVAVGRIWADGNLLRGAAGDWKVATGFRLHLGGEDQPADPLIASAEGADVAPAHRGTAYAVFEDLPLEQFGNRIPSLTFEVVADTSPVTVGAVAQAVSDGVIEGAGPALLLNGFSAYGDSARGVVEALAEMAGAWFTPAQDGLAMVNDPAAQRVVAADRGSRRIAPAGQAPRSVVVSHYDPDRDWQTGVQRATRSSGEGAVLAVDLPAALDAGAAKTIAEAMLSAAEARRTTRRIAADADAIALSPGSVIAIAGEAGAWRVRSVSVERFGVTADLLALGPPPIAVRASAGRVLRAPDAPAGATIVHAFEIPVLADGGAMQPTLTIAAAGTLPGWRRAALQLSVDDGASWTAAGGTRAPAVMGTLTAPLGVGSATLDDRCNVVSVMLAHEEMLLGDADAAALDQGANLALVGDELIQFRHADPIGGAEWRLTGLWRERCGTASEAMTPGTRFVLLNGYSALAIPIDVAIGAQVRVLASGVGDAAGVEAACRITGASLVPPAPVRLTAQVVDGGLMLEWRRRSRSDWRWRDGVDAALGGEREAYRVTVASAAHRDMLDVGEPRAAILLAPFGDAPLHVTVQQIGSRGLSAPAAMDIARRRE